MADFEDWDKDAGGRLKTWPLAAFQTALFGDGRGGLRLELALSPRPGEPKPALQLTLDRRQIRELSEALEELSDRLDDTPRVAS